MWRVLVIAAATLVVGLTGACATTVSGTPMAQRRQDSAPATPSAPSAPPVAPAVTGLGESDLDPLLLPVDDVRPIMDAPDLQVDQSYAQMPPSTVGYVPEDCVRAAYNTVEAGYRDSQFVAVRGMVMQEPAPAQVLHVVDQGVVTFPSTELAATYVTRTVEAWRRCAGSPFTALRPESAEHWTFGQVNDSDGINSIPKTADGSPWSCSRAITTQLNVVIDVSACGFSISDQATRIAAQIRDRLPK